MQTRQMQEAKAQLSELVKRARSQPQDITLHGKLVAVVVSHETFDRLSQSQGSLVEFMRHSPLYGNDELVFEREQSHNQDIAL
ncbi:MAG: type II toxin-antitoxin system Phd/YefM family antitoxin [Halothiobacillaceae bacterium]|nr:type II toxin-antitoxin system Phd/YefM family antitoxin [Halothiobacillaceae bacterium]